ncbi:MAG: ISKra4 family transposase [Leptolyngbyaceae cyanobacterium SU_3_3]|nr:ISKra4 family transposase [Leptolyngbyaceae cyanobacterium SU_3_3]
MLTLRPANEVDDRELQPLYEKLQTSITLASLVLAAWQLGLWFARKLVEQQLQERAQAPQTWSHCATCGSRLESKGFVPRRMLTLVGWVEWRRRVGRCPNRCAGSHSIPFDAVLGITAYQQTSIELMRLGCLLAVFLPFEIAVHLLMQLCGIRISDDSVWHWVQHFGRQASVQLDAEWEQLAQGIEPKVESLDPEWTDLPLAIAADGVSVPFRPQSGTAKGKIQFREVKIAVLARLKSVQNRQEQSITRLVQRRFVAVLGDLNTLQARLHLEALRQGSTSAAQVVWISDGARGFWRLFEQHWAGVAIGILDFYHAAQQLWQAAEAYGNTLPTRTSKQWFEQLRHQLRHGYVHRILKELGRLLTYASTPESAKPTLKRVQQYLSTHLAHVQYRTFKKLGFPIGSGMVESACKWLITQRFKGTGMRWSESGFNHLLHLRLAWVNQRFDSLFADHPLTLELHSPNQ